MPSSSHNLLPTSVELVQAFLKDLGNVLDASDTPKNQTTLLFFTASGSSQSWLVPQDIVVVSIIPVTGALSLCLSTDGSSYTTNFGTAGNKKVGSVLFLGGTSQQVAQNCRVPISKGQTLTFTNNGASNAAMLILYE